MSESAVASAFTAPLWRWTARSTAEPGAWCFVTVPLDSSREIREVMEGRTRGFGSVRVVVETATSCWETSVFPDSAGGCYVLPVKKAVRVAERVGEGDDVTVTLMVRDAG